MREWHSERSADEGESAESLQFELKGKLEVEQVMPLTSKSAGGRCGLIHAVHRLDIQDLNDPEVRETGWRKADITFAAIEGEALHHEDIFIPKGMSDYPWFTIEIDQFKLHALCTYRFDPERYNNYVTMVFRDPDMGHPHFQHARRLLYAGLDTYYEKYKTSAEVLEEYVDNNDSRVIGVQRGVVGLI